MWPPTSWPITRWVMMLFFMFCLKSSNETPCACAAFSMSSMESACICLRSSSSRFTSSVSAVIPRIRALLQQQLLIDQVAQHVFFVLFGLLVGGGRILLAQSESSCSRALRRSARVTMLLLTRAMISSTQRRPLGADRAKKEWRSREYSQ